MNTESSDQHNALALKEAPSVEQIVRYVKESEGLSVKDDGEAIFDALAVCLAAEKLDPLLMRVRARANVMRLLSQLSRSTYLVTWIAETMGIEFDGSPVQANEHFGEWDDTRLTQLCALLTVEASKLKTNHEESTALLRSAVLKSEADAATIKKLTDDINKERVEAKAREQLHIDNCLRYTTMLSSYKDVNRFVVSRIDPVTKNTVSYLKLEEDGTLSGVKAFGAATRFSEFSEANDLRIEAIRLRRTKVSKTQRSGIADQYVVIQLALRAVDLQTIIDESPEGEE